jgi:hypothetical protein
MPLNNFPIDVVGITIEADPTALKMDQNLSDLVDANAARTNLDVYDTGTVDTTLGGYLLLTGGSMTGAITFDATGLQNINKGTFDNSLGGYNGISLTCAVGYELNWQGGHLGNWYSGAFQPIVIDSSLDITHADGIKFSDDTVQTTAAVAGVTRDKALANAIAASMWYAWDGYDHSRTGGIVNLDILTPNLDLNVFPDVGITDGTDFVSGFPSMVSSPALNVGSYWLVVVNAETSDFHINYVVV